jgi:hypothetical protein
MILLIRGANMQNNLELEGNEIVILNGVNFVKYYALYIN